MARRANNPRHNSAQVPTLISQAVGLARLHEFLGEFPPGERLKWIAAFKDGGTISAAEADLLLDCSWNEAV
jgi:hypothetical protein